MKVTHTLCFVYKSHHNGKIRQQKKAVLANIENTRIRVSITHLCEPLLGGLLGRGRPYLDSGRGLHESQLAGGPPPQRLGCAALSDDKHYNMVFFFFN